MSPMSEPKKIETPLVSVVVPTKNPGRIFRDVLAAVMQQKCNFPFEVIVIDSGSKDGTVEFARTTAAVVIEIRSTEFGHGRTRNRAISEAKGTFVCMLTHDAKPASDSWLSELVKPLLADDNVGGSFGRHLPYPSAHLCTARDLNLHFDGFASRPAVVWIDDKEKYKRDEGYRQQLHYFSDNNACIRKSVWSECPYPDVEFAEDQLWAEQMLCRGYRKAYADQAQVYHSHDYSQWDNFRRSVDESKALHSMFGYRMCPTLAHGALQAYLCAKRDVEYVFSRVGSYAALKDAIAVPLRHLGRQLGWYLGQRSNIIPAWLLSHLSVDAAMRAGKRKGA